MNQNSQLCVNIGYLREKYLSTRGRKPNKGSMQTRESMGDHLLLDWVNLWTPFVMAEKEIKKHFEVGWQIPLVLRLFDLPHRGKLGLRQGRWIVSELDSASSDGISSCRASLVSALSLLTSVHVCVLLYSHSHMHTVTDAHVNAHCVLRLCVHLRLLCREDLQCNSRYSYVFTHAGCTARELSKVRKIMCQKCLVWKKNHKLFTQYNITYL